MNLEFGEQASNGRVSREKGDPSIRGGEDVLICCVPWSFGHQARMYPFQCRVPPPLLVETARIYGRPLRSFHILSPGVSPPSFRQQRIFLPKSLFQLFRVVLGLMRIYFHPDSLNQPPVYLKVFSISTLCLDACFPLISVILFSFVWHHPTLIYGQNLVLVSSCALLPFLDYAAARVSSLLSRYFLPFSRITHGWQSRPRLAPQV